MIYDEINDVVFSRDTISSWTENEEKQLNELQGEEYENFKRELIIKQMHVYDSLIFFEKEGKYGLKSKGFDYVVVQPKYDSINPCWSNFFVVEEDGKYGVVSTGYFDYSIVYPIICDTINSSSIDLLIIQVNGKYGILKMEGRSIRVLVEPIYDEIIKKGEEDIYVIKKDGKLGLYHHDVVVNPQFDEINVPQVFGWIKAKKDGEWGYIGIDRQFTTDVSEAFLYYSFTLIADEYV